MTIVQNTESQYKNKLSIWYTVNNQLWIQVGPENEYHDIEMQGIAIDLEDAKVLMSELKSIIEQMEN